VSLVLLKPDPEAAWAFDAVERRALLGQGREKGERRKENEKALPLFPSPFSFLLSPLVAKAGLCGDGLTV
jgi:hypothetical protein